MDERLRQLLLRVGTVGYDPESVIRAVVARCAEVIENHAGREDGVIAMALRLEAAALRRLVA